MVRRRRYGGRRLGVDIAGSPIVWCQQHLQPPFKFVTTTSLPHLPFEDRHFDLVYAGSVFTHIADLADAWLLELRRIVRPGGIVFLTVHDNSFIEAVLETADTRRRGLADMVRAFDEETRLLTAGFGTFVLGRTRELVPLGKRRCSTTPDTSASTGAAT